MTDEKNLSRLPHNLILNDRRTLSVAGVSEVVSCDEEIVVLRTVMGELTVSGSKLHIGRFDRESGELKLDGSIKELVYTDLETRQRGLFDKLFR
ncbi:MAG: sporulation protein YabP [Clostridia bacterium]|nr:sporulation protein YabP [Clostridia bacterium]MBQ1554800.1 sporulation protein YabP [Clostridia bacterium]MBQ4395979.1 sporulation protein YabP [Clostridia bacterium]